MRICVSGEVFKPFIYSQRLILNQRVSKRLLARVRKWTYFTELRLDLDLLCYNCKKNKLKMTPSILIVSLLFVGISLLVSMVLKRKFTKYGKVLLSNGMSGK